MRANPGAEADALERQLERWATTEGPMSERELGRFRETTDEWLGLRRRDRFYRKARKQNTSFVWLWVYLAINLVFGFWMLRTGKIPWPLAGVLLLVSAVALGGWAVAALRRGRYWRETRGAAESLTAVEWEGCAGRQMELGK